MEMCLSCPNVISNSLDMLLIVLDSPILYLKNSEYCLSQFTHQTISERTWKM